MNNDCEKDMYGKNCGMKDALSPKMVMERIYETGFAMQEIGLFLDTHPDNKDALDYFIAVRDENKKMKKTGQTKFRRGKKSNYNLYIPNT